MNQENTPIIKALENHVRNNPLSFHVPGHKNGRIAKDIFLNQGDFLKYDLTEIDQLDDLHHPTKCIKDAQTLLSELYMTWESKLLINGSTVGNLAAILATCEKGDQVIVGRNSHKSIFNGLKMAGCKPIFIKNKYVEDLGCDPVIEEENWLRAIEQYPTAKAIIITSPSYYGICSSIERIVECAHGKNMTVICDEAHGAHLVLDPPFPKGALSQGCDLVIQSAHKALPAMTMGAYLHIQKSFPYMERLNFYLHALQSSSPSYLIMASLDYGRHYLHKVKNKGTKEIEKSVQSVKEIICSHPQLDIYIANERWEMDPLKIIVFSNNGTTGYELQQAFEKVGIFTELANHKFVLFIHPLSVMEDLEEFRQKLNKVVLESKPIKITQDLDINFQFEEIATISFSYNELNNFPKEILNINESLGKISGVSLVPYPPGIPFILEGEEITKEKLETLKQLMELNVTIEGETLLSEGMIHVYDQQR